MKKYVIEIWSQKYCSLCEESYVEDTEVHELMRLRLTRREFKNIIDSLVFWTVIDEGPTFATVTANGRLLHLIELEPHLTEDGSLYADLIADGKHIRRMNDIQYQ